MDNNFLNDMENFAFISWSSNVNILLTFSRYYLG